MALKFDITVEAAEAIVQTSDRLGNGLDALEASVERLQQTCDSLSEDLGVYASPILSQIAQTRKAVAEKSMEVTALRKRLCKLSKAILEEIAKAQKDADAISEINLSKKL